MFLPVPHEIAGLGEIAVIRQRCETGLKKRVAFSPIRQRPNASIPEQQQVLSLNRRLRDLRTVASKLKRSRMTPFQVCEAIIEKRIATREVRTFFSGLPDDERHYWIASLYALLMPKARRRRLAAYFTPPPLAHHAINVMIDAGIQPGCFACRPHPVPPPFAIGT
jgi:hypothetical protein